MTSRASPALPFPIFQISQKVERYLLYDVDIITWLRKTHNILGVLIGTLPQIPQQNVFLGLPLELQPEEARLLVEQGVGYIVDSLQWNQQGMQTATSADKAGFRAALDKEGVKAATAMVEQKQQRMERAMKRLQLNSGNGSRGSPSPSVAEQSEEATTEESLFNPSLDEDVPSHTLSHTLPWSTTPTTSYITLQPPPKHQIIRPPSTNPSSYALFKHLHNLSYFLSPGLRFGCQFLVYPGDPLRFHSHFLATGTEWDEDFDLLDLVGGGRLGTGVKKGWLIGGTEKREEDDSESVKETLNGERCGHESGEGGQRTETGDAQVRTFCIEWGGM